MNQPASPPILRMAPGIDECRDGIGLDEPLARLVYREGFVDAPHRNHDVANESCLSGSITAVDELSGTGTESG
jgi:hypothetical protein